MAYLFVHFFVAIPHIMSYLCLLIYINKQTSYQFGILTVKYINQVRSCQD